MCDFSGRAAKMNFRQRIAWLCVVIYLALTCAVMYCIFEITDSYNVFALDHVERYHSQDSDKQVQEMLSAHQQKKTGLHVAQESADEHDVMPSGTAIIFSFLWHMTDVPLAVWMLILFLPYLQVFFMLMACTKQEPRFSLAYIWPVYLYFKCRNWYHCVTGRNLKPINSPIPNGHALLNT